MFARFDENPAMTLRVIKETKRYERTDGRTHGQRENSIPPTNKVCGGYKNNQKASDSLLCRKVLDVVCTHVTSSAASHDGAVKLTTDSYQFWVAH